MIKIDYDYHREIEPEDKERLQKIIDLISPRLEGAGYDSVRFLKESRLLGGNFQPRNLVRIYYTKDNVKYSIVIEIFN